MRSGSGRATDVEGLHPGRAIDLVIAGLTGDLSHGIDQHAGAGGTDRMAAAHNVSSTTSRVRSEESRPSFVRLRAKSV